MITIEDKDLKTELLKLKKEGKTVREILEQLKISRKTYYKILGKSHKNSPGNNSKTDGRTRGTLGGQSVNDNSSEAPKSKKITFEPDHLSELFSSFLEHIENIGFASMDEFLKWRGEILPFLARNPSEHRDLLYHIPFIWALSSPDVKTRRLCQLVLRNVLEQEFTLRLKEIEKLKQPSRQH